MAMTPLDPGDRITVKRIASDQLVAHLHTNGKMREIAQMTGSERNEVDFIWTLRGCAAFHKLMIVLHTSVTAGRKHLQDMA
jgi:hypothetical protein